MKILAVCNHVGGLNAVKSLLKEINSEHSVHILTNTSNKGRFNDLSLPIFYIDYRITVYQAIEFFKQK